MENFSPANRAEIPARRLKEILLGPDYMSRAGPVNRAALLRAGPVVV